jgi:hypothetical protein
MLIPPTPSVMKRFKITKMPIWPAICSSPRCRATMNAADIRPKTAPDAPTVNESGVRSSAPNEPARSETKYTARNRGVPIPGSSRLPRK